MNEFPTVTDERGEALIKIAADHIESLRMSDVFRVLDDCPADELPLLARWIVDWRPDLNSEVRECLAEISR